MTCESLTPRSHSSNRDNLFTPPGAYPSGRIMMTVAISKALLLSVRCRKKQLTDKSQLYIALPTNLHMPRLSALREEYTRCFCSSFCASLAASCIDSLSYSYDSCFLDCPCTSNVRLILHSHPVKACITPV